MGREALGALTYTQWEAWLAISSNQYGARKNLVIVAPADGLERGEKFKPTDASRASQADHLRRLNAINLYAGPRFTSADNLVAQVLASAVLDTLIAAGTPPKTKPRNLTLVSLSGLFSGRDQALEDLREALLAAKGGAVALHGLGGVDKTRPAIEYGWAREADQRESGTETLQKAVAAYRAALEKWTRERVPLEWAATHMNLSNALEPLAERQKSAKLMEEAVISKRASARLMRSDSLSAAEGIGGASGSASRKPTSKVELLLPVTTSTPEPVIFAFPRAYCTGVKSSHRTRPASARC
jgi:hypothetical protein